MSTRSITPRVAFAVARRPALWVTAIGQARRLAPVGWWRSWPFLPLPSREYAAFRMQTHYGDDGADPQPRDVLNYLAWCRQWQRRERA